MRDIEEAARDILSNVLYYANDDDGIEDLREACYDSVHEAADNMCIYPHNCEEYINELEAYYDSDEFDGTEYPPSQWREAMQAYAFGLVHNAIGCSVSGQLDDTDDQLDLFWTEVMRLTDHYGVDFNSVKSDYDNECRFGWAAHNYETEEGVMVWSDENGHFHAELLEGELVAVSFSLECGIWIHACFDPRENKVTTE